MTHLTKRTILTRRNPQTQIPNPTIPLALPISATSKPASGNTNSSNILLQLQVSHNKSLFKSSTREMCLARLRAAMLIVIESSLLIRFERVRGTRS
ncbi:hypothetical protein ACFX13_034460 [Malus domestica]